jgi:hypothetical protein
VNQVELLPLERAVLEMITRGDSQILQTLKRQIARSTVARREYTGVGFFTYLLVPDDVPRVSGVKDRFPVGDIRAEIIGLDHGAGFLLWVEVGCASCLEGYTYDEPWPEVVGTFNLREFQAG